MRVSLLVEMGLKCLFYNFFDQKSLLQFVDDTIFLAKACPESLQNLKLILLVFRQLSGLKINLEKSTFFGINVNQESLTSLTSILECIISMSIVLFGSSFR